MPTSATTDADRLIAEIKAALAHPNDAVLDKIDRQRLELENLPTKSASPGIREIPYVRFQWFCAYSDRTLERMVMDQRLPIGELRTAVDHWESEFPRFERCASLGGCGPHQGSILSKSATRWLDEMRKRLAADIDISKLPGIDYLERRTFAAWQMTIPASISCERREREIRLVCPAAADPNADHVVIFDAAAPAHWKDYRLEHDITFESGKTELRFRVRPERRFFWFEFPVTGTEKEEFAGTIDVIGGDVTVRYEDGSSFADSMTESMSRFGGIALALSPGTAVTIRRFLVRVIR